MNSIDPNMTKQVIDCLRDSVLALKPAGAEGFEGLIRVVLTKLTGIPFRLAASGLQGGIDGKSSFSADEVCFEGKRYDGPVPRNEIITKIADLARNEAADRLWVLGASTEVSTQIADDVRTDGDKNAVSTLILDWTFAPLPLLAVAIVAADNDAISFLAENFINNNAKHKQRTREELRNIFNQISDHPDYCKVLARIKSELKGRSLALKTAVKANKKWRAEVFQSRSVAKERVGQGLCILADPSFPEDRTEIEERIQDHISNQRNVVICGQEGVGKSWLAAQVAHKYDGLVLFASAEKFDGFDLLTTDDFLIKLLIEQTDDVADQQVANRWRHRLAAWEGELPALGPLVVVDGINQRPKYRWDRIINAIQERLNRINGRLIVTVRPQYWNKEIVQGVDNQPTRINVPEWSEQELLRLLKYYKIDTAWLDRGAFTTLRNPRLLGVAVTVLPLDDERSWQGLTTDRLLFEHLRHSQRESFEPETFRELTGRISHHAKMVLDRVRNADRALKWEFEEQSGAVIETRFFESLEGPGQSYVLRDEGLTLALGFAFIDQLWQSRNADEPLDSRIEKLIDPVQSMDRIVDVVLASLLICACDEIRFDEAIFGAVLNAFSNLQNVDEKRLEEFICYVETRPAEFYSCLRRFCLERGVRVNFDWFVVAAFHIIGSVEGRVVATSEIKKWMWCYNKNARDQMARFPRSQPDDYSKQLKATSDRIDNTLNSFATFEQDLLERMTEVLGDTDSLYTLGLRLLAGQPLSEFAESFVALGLGFALDYHTYHARKAFRNLTTFNRADPDHAAKAFLSECAPLRSANVSESGKWSLVRMLYASGRENAAEEAMILATRLRENQNFPYLEHNNDWRSYKVRDPRSDMPADFESGIKLFKQIDADKILQSMSPDIADMQLRDFLPIACCFSPEDAVKKIREILDGLVTRVGLPLRQLIFNFSDMIPLVRRDLALRLVNRVAATDINAAMPERDQNALKMFLLGYAIEHLSAEEQLHHLSGDAFGTDFLRDVIPFIRAPSVDKILSALRQKMDDDDERAIYGILGLAFFGIPDGQAFKLDDTLSKCCTAIHSGRIRSLLFALAIKYDLSDIRRAHYLGNWSAKNSDLSTYESWYGSLLLIESYKRDEINIDGLLGRISPLTWFEALKDIGDELSQPLSEQLLVYIKTAIAKIETLGSPQIDLEVSKSIFAPYALISFDETRRGVGRFEREKSLEDMLRGGEDFEERKDRLSRIFEELFSEIDGDNVRLLFQGINFTNVKHLLDKSLNSPWNCRHPITYKVRQGVYDAQESFYR